MRHSKRKGVSTPGQKQSHHRRRTRDSANVGTRKDFKIAEKIQVLCRVK